MSTRANIIIKDQWDELIFYRHSDGYPEECGERLKLFLSWVKEGKIRDNVGQAAGWLILLGAMEYKSLKPEAFESREAWDHEIRGGPDPDDFSGWKCGAFEPTTGIHGDIEYLYVVDLETKKLHIDGKNKYRYTGKFSREEG